MGNKIIATRPGEPVKIITLTPAEENEEVARNAQAVIDKAIREQGRADKQANKDNAEARIMAKLGLNRPQMDDLKLALQ